MSTVNGYAITELVRARNAYAVCMRLHGPRDVRTIDAYQTLQRLRLERDMAKYQAAMAATPELETA
jgi:hypothetical protein